MTIDAELRRTRRGMARSSRNSPGVSIEQRDPAVPQFVRVVDDHSRLFGGNRDADYDYVAIDAARSYLIAGVRGTSRHFDCTAYAPDGKGHNRITATVSDRHLTLGENRQFALYLSATPPPPQLRAATWIELAPDTTAVIMRQCYLHRAVEVPARYDIVCMSPRPPTALTRS